MSHVNQWMADILEPVERLDHSPLADGLGDETHPGA